jgi:hypothetical protein
MGTLPAKMFNEINKSPNSERFRSAPRTFRPCCDSLKVLLRAAFEGDLTMSERAVEVGQGWASDIIGIVTGVGLYSVLFSLVIFLCLYFPA